MELNEIKKLVTHFSLELQKASQLEEVVVGGEIKSIVPPADDNNPMYILILDDQVGVHHVFVSDRMFSAHLEHLKIGNNAFIEGYVNHVVRLHGKDPSKEVFVYGYGLKDTKETEGAH